MIELKKYQEAMKSLPQGAIEAEVNAETHDMVIVSVQKGMLLDVQFAKQTALFVRVSGEKTGYVYTQNLEDDANLVLKKAYENSFYSESKSADSMNRTATKKIYADEKAECRVEVLQEKADQIEKWIEQAIIEKGMKKVSVEVKIKAETYGQRTVNSWGLDVGHMRPLYILTLKVAMEDQEQMIEVTLQLASGKLDGFHLEYAAKNLTDRLRWQVNPTKKFESADYPVILSDEAVYKLFATAWQEFSACKYLEQSSQLAGSLGEKVGAGCLGILDDPTMNGFGYPMDCDAEGSEGKSVHLIENGMLTGLLHNTATASVLHAENTGNAGRRPLLFGNIATDILVTPKNFCFQPGNATLAEMEEHMQDGILITEYMDEFHTLDVVSGNFSAPCYGVRIRDGKEVENLTALTVSGNFKELLASVLEMGKDHELRPMIDLENYGIAPCTLRVKSLNVSGE